jgi:hypothetical protein
LGQIASGKAAEIRERAKPKEKKKKNKQALAKIWEAKYGHGGNGFFLCPSLLVFSLQSPTDKANGHHDTTAVS